MWYFAWMLGVGFAVLLAVLNAMWGENEEGRSAASQAISARDQDPAPRADAPTKRKRR